MLLYHNMLGKFRKRSRASWVSNFVPWSQQLNTERTRNWSFVPPPKVSSGWRQSAREKRSEKLWAKRENCRV